ncbi:MAG: hypothetical protein AAFN70_11095, partial [Planctomycetota bacterium]
QIFFPTVHIHDGQLHDREHFDHQLFAQSNVLDEIAGAYRTPKHIDTTTGWTRSNRTAGDFMSMDKTLGLVAPNQLVHRKLMRGMLANTDTFASLDKFTYSAASSSQFWIVGGIAALAAAPMAWIIRRRMQMSQRDSAT